MPSQHFLKALKTQPGLFIKLLSNYAQRIGELTGVIDRLMMRDLNAELRALLIEKADAQKQVFLFHQMMADELASSREVISRKLKTLEKSGPIQMSRGKVTLTKLT